MIKNKSIRLKRIKREIFNLDLLDNNFNIIHENESLKIICEDKYMFLLNYDYPFKPPIFYINNYNYEKFLIPKNKKIRDIIFNYYGCPHCNSILYYWSPTHFIYDLIKEYIKNKKIYYKCFLIYVIKLIMYKNINDKYLIMNILEYIT